MTGNSRTPTDANVLVPVAHAGLDRPTELTLEPVDGIAKWLGRTLGTLALRAVSMEEQDPALVRAWTSPTKGYFRRDRHVHPIVEPTSYRLSVTGVANPRVFTLADLSELPREHRVCVMECAGNGNHVMGSAGLMGQAHWSGPSFASLLDACGGPGDATHFAFHGLDRVLALKAGYHYGLSLAELTSARALLALEMNGQPLSRRHGFPVRLIVPRIYSMSHVKWLGSIEGKPQPHQGIHNRLVFTNKERHGQRWVRVQVRWIGLKSMLTRCHRCGDAWELHGWAWGGGGPIARVDVTTDGGQCWEPAEIRSPSEMVEADEPLRASDVEGAWCSFSYRWRPHGSGPYLLASRAYDQDGRAQPLEPDPNVRGHFDQTAVKWRKVNVP